MAQVEKKTQEIKADQVDAPIHWHRPAQEIKTEQLASLIHWQWPTLVLFYVPWCTVCIDMMLFWNMLASKLSPVTSEMEQRIYRREAVMPARGGSKMPAHQSPTIPAYRGTRKIERLSTSEGSLCVTKMNADRYNRSARQYGVESTPSIMLFAGGETFSYDMAGLYDTAGFKACAKKSDALVTQVVDWIAAKMDTVDTLAMEAHQRELQAIEDRKLDGVPLTVTVSGFEFPVHRASFSTVRDLKDFLLAKAGLDGRDLQFSPGGNQGLQTVFSDKDLVRKLPQEVHATVVALATFKQPERRTIKKDDRRWQKFVSAANSIKKDDVEDDNEETNEMEEPERLCDLSENSTTATCIGETFGCWQVVEGNFHSDATLGFAIRLDKLQGQGAVENVCIGVAPADFALNDENDCLQTNAVIVTSGSSLQCNQHVEECNEGQNWKEGNVIRVVFQGVSGRVMFFWDGDQKATYSPQLKRPVHAVVFMRHPGDQVTFVDARM